MSVTNYIYDVECAWEDTNGQQFQTMLKMTYIEIYTFITSREFIAINVKHENQQLLEPITQLFDSFFTTT